MVQDARQIGARSRIVARVPAEIFPHSFVHTPLLGRRSGRIDWNSPPTTTLSRSLIRGLARERRQRPVAVGDERVRTHGARLDMAGRAVDRPAGIEVEDALRVLPDALLDRQLEAAREIMGLRDRPEA